MMDRTSWRFPEPDASCFTLVPWRAVEKENSKEIHIVVLHKRYHHHLHHHHHHHTCAMIPSLLPPGMRWMERPGSCTVVTLASLPFIGSDKEPAPRDGEGSFFICLASRLRYPSWGSRWRGIPEVRRNWLDDCFYRSIVLLAGWLISTHVEIVTVTVHLLSPRCSCS